MNNKAFLKLVITSCCCVSLFTATQGWSEQGLSEDALLAQLSPGEHTDEYRVVLAPRSTAVVSARVNSLVSVLPRELGQSFKKGDSLVVLEKYKQNFKKS